MRWTLFSLNIFVFLSFVSAQSAINEKSTCRKNEFSCKGKEDKCLPISLICDHHEDCPDGEDEVDCASLPPTLPTTSTLSTTFVPTTSTVPTTGTSSSTSVSTTATTSSTTTTEKMTTRTTTRPTTTSTTAQTSTTKSYTSIATTTYNRCEFLSFRCNNGQCVPLFKRCDSNRDCDDGSDEDKCISSYECPKGFFNCKTDGTNGCIPSLWVCDGVKDCTDGQDENECHLLVPCAENYIKCQNKRCVDEKLRCNGVDDCGDATDELMCRSVVAPVPKCAPDNYQCHMGPCILKDLLCNGFRDCPHNDDEANCTSALETCQPGFFSCPERACIPESWVCDDEKDCAGGLDEMNCNSSVVTTKKSETEKKQKQDFCKPSEFHCNSGECIDRRKLCDYNKDCVDGSDEHIWCDACKEDNGGCQMFCNATPIGVECSCSSGHRLLSDHQKCADVDECAENNNLCDHFCNNTRGRYYCYCAPGYTLALDGSTCKLTSTEGFLLFSTGPEIRQVALNENQQGAHYGQLYEVETGDVLGLDHDNVNHHTYYLTENKIYFMFETPICAIEGMHHGINVAVDWVTNNIYFADEFADATAAKLGVCFWDGRYCTSFAMGDLNTVRGLVVHPKRGIMLWTDWGQAPRIEKANMDGTKRVAIITEKVRWPNAVTLDYVREKVYWAEAKWQMIERCNLDGSNREVVVSKNVRHPFDMVVFMDKIFWSDWSNQAIMAAGVNDHVNNIIHSVIYHPFGVTVSHPAYHDGTLFNPCKTANCSHICALKANDTYDAVGFSCLCPAGYTLLQDNITCFPTSSNLISTPQWCVDTFRNACKHGHACKNDGVCRETYDKNKDIEQIKCECPKNFAGLYCEISLDEVNWKQLISSSLKVHHEYLLTDQRQGSGGAATTTIIVLIVLVCFAVATVYAVRRVDFSSRHFQGLKWNPAVLFRRRLSSQREHFIHHEEGANPKLEKAESFSNPVYEAVNVPIHSAYMSFKKKSVSSDCGDNDSGLEFNVSRSSASSPSSPSLC